MGVPHPSAIPTYNIHGNRRRCPSTVVAVKSMTGIERHKIRTEDTLEHLVEARSSVDWILVQD